MSYSSGFTVTGAPPPTVTQFSGDLPPGLTLVSDGALTSVTPTSGPPGTAVTILGAGFTDTSDVLFGGAEALTVVSDTQLRAVAPARTRGSARAAQGLGLSVPVVVVGPGGTSNALTFTYTPQASAPGGCDPLASPCGAVPDQPGGPPTVAPPVGDDGGPAVVIGKRVHVVVDPADRVDEANERDNAAHIRIR